MIPIMVTTITDGNFGIFFFATNKNTKQAKNNQKAYILVCCIFKKVSQTQIYIFSLCGIFNHNAELNCPAAIDIQTQMRNP